MPLQSRRSYRLINIIIITLTFVSLIQSNGHLAEASKSDINSSILYSQVNISTQIYLPIIQSPSRNLPTLNIPNFENSAINFHQAAVSWFGQVRGNENYADVRIGYNSQAISVRVSVFDRYLWYDETPDINKLTDWDAVTLYLDINGNGGNKLGPTMFQFTRQLQWWDDHQNRQVAYQGSASGWEQVPINFSTSYGWRGNAPNDAVEDRGYLITFQIPFSSLGYTNAPPLGTQWGASITLHDRDDAGGSTISKKYWVEGFDDSRSHTWGQLSFGLPKFTPPPVSNPQTYTISNGLNAAQVTDGVVGGNTQCGQGLDYWTEWGDHAYPHVMYMNVQNQGNIDDWPCFSKFYITFPLDSLPTGKKIISATLTLHQAGQATGFQNDPPEALNSLIQVSVINQSWDENSLSWNSAPLPIENVSQSWVGFITQAELGKASDWDLSSALSSAYLLGQPLRLVLYSADSYGPNGKYFYSSDESWEIMRPSITVELGN
jgi:hypothetical protein